MYLMIWLEFEICTDTGITVVLSKHPADKAVHDEEEYDNK